MNNSLSDLGNQEVCKSEVTQGRCSVEAVWKQLACKSHTGINNSSRFVLNTCNTSLPHQTNTHRLTETHTHAHGEKLLHKEREREREMW